MRGLSTSKTLPPKKFGQKDDQWREWADEIRDYMEVVKPGMKDVLTKAEKQRDLYVINTAWATGVDPEMGKLSKEVYRALKLYTDRGTEANQVVLSVPEEDGFAAWVMLHRRFGMALAMRQGVALANFSNLGTKRCNTPAETRSRVIEIDRVARATQEVTGEPIGEGHWKSALVGMLDPVTRQHTASLMGSGTSVADLKRAILEFTANVSVDKDIMDIGRVSQETEDGAGSRMGGDHWPTSGDWDTEAAGANAVGRGGPKRRLLGVRR